MAEIVKYHNDINSINFTGFKEKEIDILFTLMLKSKESTEKEIIVSFGEFNRLIDGEQNKARIKEYILETSKKLKKIDQVLELPDGRIRIFSLFDFIEIDPNKKIVTFSVNKDFKYLLNNLVGNFTLFELKELVQLKGYYPKRIFTLLKQWESTRKLIIGIEEFRNNLGIPKKYRMSDIRKDIIKPCLEELKSNFYKLEVLERKVGRQVETLEFTWKSKKKKDVIEIEPIIKKRSSIGEKELQKHQEQFQEINQINQVEKIKITQEEYDQMYKEYLKKHNTKDDLLMRSSFKLHMMKGYEVVESQKKECVQAKVYTVEEIEESLLLDKNGKKIVGGSLLQRLKKISKEKNIKISYKEKIIFWDL